MVQMIYLDLFPDSDQAILDFIDAFEKSVAAVLSLESELVTVKKFERALSTRSLLAVSVQIEYAIELADNKLAHELTVALNEAVGSGKLSSTLASSGVSGVAVSAVTVTILAPTATPTTVPESIEGSRNIQRTTIIATLCTLGGVLVLIAAIYIHRKANSRPKIYLVNREYEIKDNDEDLNEILAPSYILKPYRNDIV